MKTENENQTETLHFYRAEEIEFVEDANGNLVERVVKVLWEV